MKKQAKRLVCILLSLLIATLTACSAADQTNQISTTAEPTEQTTVLPKESIEEGIDYSCPVDFDEFMSVNREVYSYIYIPGTNIEYPIVQSNQDDNFYLRRNWKGEKQNRGCIFTQSINSVDFGDPVTVIYGHNTDKGDMFSELLNFKDSDFFDSHSLIYIYLPYVILVYRVFSAHTFDNRHIMNSYDFNNVDELLDYQNTILHPSALEKNIRDGIEIDENSYIITLSTCAEPVSGCETRFLVNGVLVNYVLTD